MDVSYVYQRIDNPDGFTVPEGRIKPWGTAHAVMSCIGTVTDPFIVINADDFTDSRPFKDSPNGWILPTLTADLSNTAWRDTYWKIP